MEKENTKKLKFRNLRADEIECRIGTISENGLTLLLFKDARCDMNILDETVGPLNWKREHTRDNANCIVSIYDEEKKQWVSKEDTGKESFNEAEKGLASDSFKRACVNWGIGRELYTAPLIYIPSNKCTIYKNAKGKLAVKEVFKITKIEYNENDVIKSLQIINNKPSDNKRFTIVFEKEGK